jgi:hypothetical protein
MMRTLSQKMLGQIAQQVEQGTENPRVGGSIPSLATIFVGCVLAAGCGQDDCEALCQNVSDRLDVCLDEWPVEWASLDARSRARFRGDCLDRWADVRVGLEPRELNDALEQCDDARAALAALSRDRESCDALRALYVEP